MTKFFNSLLLLSLLALSSCKECIEIELYRFKSEFFILPEQRIYAIGDTLKFQSKVPFSHVFADKPIATRFVLTCVLGMNREAKDSTIAIPASLDFDIIPVIGDAEVISDSIPTYIFTYEVIDTNYIIEFSIIPKSTGYFKIFYDQFNGKIKDYSQCSNSLDMYEMLNGNNNNNVEWRDSIIGYPTLLNDKKRSYFFEVK